MMEVFSNSTALPIFTAILGAVITGVFAIILHKITLIKKKIICSYWSPLPLISVDDVISDDLHIEYKSEIVGEISQFPIILKNAGNIALENLEISVSLQNSPILFGIKAGNRGTGEVVFSDFQKNEEGIIISAPLLNPKETLDLRIIFGDIGTEVPKIRIRQKNLIVKYQSIEEVLAKYEKFFRILGVPFLSNNSQEIFLTVRLKLQQMFRLNK